jgi:hypothetical protein
MSDSASPSAGNALEGAKISVARRGRPNQQHHAVGEALQLIRAEVGIGGDQLGLSFCLILILE